MSFSWKQYEGQVINNTFPLLKYVGGSGESAVFLTQLAGPQSSKAVVKLIPEGPSPDLQLSLWRRASKLTHSNLLQLFLGGRSRLADMDLLYVVMEYAEEDLSQILPQRGLTPAETRDMLGPVLDALSNLHSQGLVHSHLKPSNILATADQVKLSTDRLFPAGEVRKSASKRSPYDAPETASQPLTAASDVWSLGVMLIEVLTQKGPVVPGSLSSVGPESLPQPFRDIAQHALERDPRLRWSIDNITASLNSRAAAAAQSASPLSVPLSTVPAIPAAKLPAPKRPLFSPPPKPAPAMPRLAPSLAKAQAPSASAIPPLPPLGTSLPKAPRPELLKVGGAKRDIVLPSYVIPVAVGVLVVVSIIALPKFLSRGVESSSPAPKNTKARAVAPEREERPSSAEVSRSAKSNSTSASRDTLKSSAAQPAIKEISKPPAASPSPAILRTETKSAADSSNSSATASETSSGSSSSGGEVLDQVLPDVPEKALSTITGKVRVAVRARVDAAGNVADAEFEDPGPSEYFAKVAMKAVRRWEFTSPEVGGHSVPSEWLVRFEFAPDGIKVFPKQITP